MRRLVLVPLLLLLTTCTSSTYKLPFEPVFYKGEVIVRSSLPARLTVQTTPGVGEGSTMVLPIGAIMVPYSTSPEPGLFFDATDQVLFSDALKSELLRRGVIGSVTEQPGPNAVQIDLNFLETHHDPTPQKYTAKVVLRMSFGTATEERRYDFVSSEGDSFGQRMNTNAPQAKAKLTSKMMTALMSDIQSFVKRVAIPAS
jgi:hypothetical protein